MGRTDNKPQRFLSGAVAIKNVSDKAAKDGGYYAGNCRYPVPVHPRPLVPSGGYIALVSTGETIGTVTGGDGEFVSWDHRFFDPITMPGRKPLITLRDAALYITKLPKAEHDAEACQAPRQAPLLVPGNYWPTLFAPSASIHALPPPPN